MTGTFKISKTTLVVALAVASAGTHSNNIESVDAVSMNSVGQKMGCLAPENTEQHKWKYTNANGSTQTPSTVRPGGRSSHWVLEELANSVQCKVGFEDLEFSSEQRPVVIHCEEGQEAVIGDADCPDPEDYEKERVRCPLCMSDLEDPKYHASESGCGKSFCARCIERWVAPDPEGNTQPCPMCKRSGEYHDGVGPGLMGPTRRPLRVKFIRNIADSLRGLEVGPGLELAEDRLLHTGSNDITHSLQCEDGYEINSALLQAEGQIQKDQIEEDQIQEDQIQGSQPVNQIQGAVSLATMVGYSGKLFLQVDFVEGHNEAIAKLVGTSPKKTAKMQGGVGGTETVAMMHDSQVPPKNWCVAMPEMKTWDETTTFRWLNRLMKRGILTDQEYKTLESDEVDGETLLQLNGDLLGKMDWTDSERIDRFLGIVEKTSISISLNNILNSKK
jgi:hypothetical protein